MLLLFSATKEAIPALSAAPEISGTAVVGETLTCSTGTWVSKTTPSYTYQWERSGTPISGATNNTYTLQSDDLGETVTCVVTATNTSGSASAETDPTATISSAPPTASLDFDGSTDYLSLSNASWGSYNRDKWAFACAVYIDAFTSNEVFFSKMDAAAADQEFRLVSETTKNLKLFVRHGDATLTQIETAANTLANTAAWYAILVHFDFANATASERVKFWVNGSPVAVTGGSLTKAMNSSAADARIGAFPAGSAFMDGLIYQPTFFDGVLPAAADVFDGTAGKLKGLSGITGAFSLLDASTATFDVVKATNWTNNGTVTTSASVP